jgi:manganese-dependent inorganic pyrophosphatase
MIIVTPKINPDLDGYACAYAYAEFLNKQGNEAIGICSGEPQREVIFLNRYFNLEPLAYDKASLEESSRIILVDASRLQGMPEGTRLEKIGEIIDHRDSPDVQELFPNADIQIEKVGAAATLVAERFRNKNIDISRESAILLYCAIASNTLNFQANVTTQRDRDICQWLESITDIPKNLISEMFTFKSDFTDDTFKKTIIGDFKEIALGDKLLGVGQLEVVGLNNILGSREQQIITILEEMKNNKNTDFIFLSAVDLDNGLNIFITNHEPTKELLGSVLNISFGDKNMAQKNGVILRKELIPLFREVATKI